MARKISGKGSRERMAPGKWRVRFNLGYDPVTQRHLYSPWRTFYDVKNKSDVNRRAEDYCRELEGSEDPVAIKRGTVASYLRQYHEFREGSVKDTYYRRESLLLKEAEALFGDLGLRKLSPALLREFYQKARETDELSPRELYMLHAFARRGLNQAVRDGAITRNPAKAVTVPKPDYRPHGTLTPEEGLRFREVVLGAERTSNIIATILLMETGCRRGEVLGLTWRNFLPECNRIAVVQQLAENGEITTPKSKTSRRRVALTAETTEILCQWKEEQARELAEKGIEQTPDTPVAHALGHKLVENPDGEKVATYSCNFINPHNYNRFFRDFCVANDFEKFTKGVRERKSGGRIIRTGQGCVGLTPHGLRHLQATILIGAGADVRTVQARLGHNDPSVTLRIYAEALESNDDAAAAAFDQALSRTGAQRD